MHKKRFFPFPSATLMLALVRRIELAQRGEKFDANFCLTRNNVPTYLHSRPFKRMYVLKNVEFGVHEFRLCSSREVEICIPRTG